MNDYTREELIELCERSVVNYKNWNNRDSYAAQVQLNDIYNLLKIGADYDVDSSSTVTLYINFINVTDEQKKEYLKRKYSLNIDSRDDYFNEYGYDSEMFNSNGISIDSSYIGGYIPSAITLETVNGKDWY